MLKKSKIIGFVSHSTAKLSVIAMATAMTVATPASAEDITYADWWGGLSLITSTIEFMESDFESKYDKYDVKRSVIAYPQMLNQMTLASIAGNAPDVYLALAAWVPTLQAVDALQPLDGGVLPDSFLEKIPQNARDAVSIDGSLYAIPLAPGPITLQYNRNLLSEAGFDAPAQDWEELKKQILEICKLETQSGQNVYGIALRTKRVANSAQWFIPIVYGQAGDIVDADGKPAFNTPEMAAALQWLKDISDAGCTPKGASVEETRSLMAEGRAGYILEGPWGAGLMTNLSGGKMKTGPDADYWVTTIPADLKGNVRGIANDHVLVVSKGTKDLEGALTLLRYMTSDPDFASFAYQETKFMTSANTDILSQGPLASDDYIQVHVDALPMSNTNPIKHPKFSAMMDELTLTIQAVISGGDIQSELEKLDSRIARVTTE